MKIVIFAGNSFAVNCQWNYFSVLLRKSGNHIGIVSMVYIANLCILRLLLNKKIPTVRSQYFCTKFRLYAGLTVILKMVTVWDLPYITVINDLWISTNVVA